MRDRLLSRFLIRHKLPLGVAFVAVASSATLTLAAYFEARRSAEEAAATRLHGLVEQMVESLDGSVAQLIRRRAPLGADSTVLARLRMHGDVAQLPSDSAVRAAIMPDTVVVAATLYASDGSVAVSGGDSTLAILPLTDLGDERTHPDSTGIGAMRASTESMVFPIIVPVIDSGVNRGTVVVWRRNASSPAARTRITRLLGSGAALLLGSYGGAWTDQETMVTEPPIEMHSLDTVAEYHRAGAGRQIGMAGLVKGTPWVVVIEFPRDVVYAQVNGFLTRMLAIAAIVIALGLLVAWSLGRHIADPLEELTTAANAMTMHSATRVQIDGDDELSHLGAAFNQMAQRVEDESTARDASEEQWRLLFTGNPHSMWVFDTNTLQFLAVNDATVRQYGYTRDELLGMTIAEIRPVADRAGVAAMVAALPPQTSAPLPVRHARKDGTPIDVEVHSHAVRFDGRWARLVLAHDVTDRTALENQFRHAQKMEAVGRLAGGVAHDFNNLLAVIMAHTEMISGDTPGTDPRSEGLREVLTATKRAHSLTRQLLTFSRQQVMAPATVLSNDIVVSTARMLQPLLGEDVEVRTVLQEMQAGIQVDVGQFEQVLVNLAVNARDAMPRGGTLTIATSTIEVGEHSIALYGLSKPGNYVVISVTDTGAGMDAVTKARLFEPFFTTKEAGKGTGLGLATAYGIIAQSGGHIGVYSELGSGTTFRIYLPAVAADTAVSQPIVREAPTGGSDVVMLVEDDPAVRVAVDTMLRRLGYTVVVASSGAEALDLAVSHGDMIDLLITDVIMPRMDGPTLATAFEERYPRTRVLLMSGYAGDIIANRGAMALGIPLIQKPFSMTELAAKIRGVLDS